MLIRSQDKKSLCNYNSGIVTCFEKYDYEVINNSMVPTKIEGYNIFFSNNGNEILLGFYSTKEKAIKVLDMIESFYSNLQYTRFAGSDYSEFFDVIFQMPQDEDV